MADKNVKWYSHSGEEFGNVNKLKHTHTTWLSSWTPGHLSQRNENLCGMKTYTQMSLAVLFVIALSWKQPRYPVIEWVAKPPIHTMEYYSLMKRNRLLIQLGWTSRIIWWMKKASLKRSHSIWLDLYNILEMTKL